MSERIALVHLVRHANGDAPFDAFLASYERHDAGIDHELVLLCKGFPDPDSLTAVRRRARHLGALELTVPDDGFDVTAYLAAARDLPHDRICFVNSFSTILAGRWLALLSGALDAPGIGIAGATGSWASHSSFALAMLRLPNGYGAPLGDRSALEAPGSVPAAELAPQRLGHYRALATAALKLPGLIAAYPGFPAPHVRTNAFLIERQRLLELRRRAPLTKSAAYRFEGGRGGVTSQLLARGLGAVVVGRDGIVVGSDRWPEADIFWQGTQRDLLVADNQTHAYEHGSPAARDALARTAWGPHARPAGHIVNA